MGEDRVMVTDVVAANGHGSKATVVAANGHEKTATDGNGQHEDVEILVVGVMRTGLQTLHEALRRIGYNDIFDQDELIESYEHWDEVLQNKGSKATFHSMFNGYQVVMGMPTFCFWEQILDAYPNARVILTVRDEDEWWDSIHRGLDEMGSDGQAAALKYGSTMRFFEELLLPSYHKYCNLLRFAWATTLGIHALADRVLNEASTRSSYRKHNAYVQSVLGSKTSDGKPKLLVYNVKEGWDPLCKFLEKEEPAEEFPSVRAVPFFPGSGHDGAESNAEEPMTQSPTGIIQTTGLIFEEKLVSDNAFGVIIRKEMGRSCRLLFFGLTLTMTVLFAAHSTHLITIPWTFVIFFYLALSIILWNTYIVMYWMVMRVSTLMVLPMAMKSVCTACMLHICFIAYGMLKEILVTQDKVASPILVFASRFLSVVCGAGFLLLSEGKLTLGAPLQSFGAFAFTNELSTWAGYEMLRYVSFPVQVMAKSCKMLPTMIMGTVMGHTSYEWWQYLQGVGALVCVAIMHFAGDEHKSSSKDHSVDHANLSFDTERMQNAIWGTALLVLFFAADSFTSQFQSKLYKTNKELNQTRMMLAGNSVGLIISATNLWASRTKVMASLDRAVQDEGIVFRIFALGMCGALGQFCIYYAIKALGPLSFTWIMTARQLLSVLISLIWFGHGISVLKIFCILTVFAIMSSRQLAKAIPKGGCCRCRERPKPGERPRTRSRSASCDSKDEDRNVSSKKEA